MRRPGQRTGARLGRGVFWLLVAGLVVLLSAGGAEGRASRPQASTPIRAATTTPLPTAAPPTIVATSVPPTVGPSPTPRPSLTPPPGGVWDRLAVSIPPYIQLLLGGLLLVILVVVVWLVVEARVRRSIMRRQQEEALAAPPPPMETSVSWGGMTIDSTWLVLEELGTGQTGRVMKALDTVLDRVVAVKLLRKRLMSDPHMRDVLFHEARTMAQLNHPNVVQVYHCDEWQEQLFIVMEYVKGTLLSALLDRRPDHPLDDALTVVVLQGVLSALVAAHAKRIYHRDLKPANIMICEDEATRERYVKVLDFGLAYAIIGGDPHSVPHQLRGGYVLGTLNYMSPEQTRGKEPTDKADVYGAGALAYRMLTGRHVFLARSVDELVMHHRSRPPQDPQELRPSLRREVADLVLSMLKKSPHDRPSAAEALQRLEELEWRLVVES